MADPRPTPDDLAEQATALRRLARGLVREADVDDVVQDTLVAAWRHPTGPRGGLAAWLRGIARNLARKSHRSRARRERREAAAARREGRPPTAEVVARIEVQRLVLAEVRRLEDPYRTAIWLRYFEDLPPRRIAREMDAPVATVHTWLARGRERLRLRLDDAHDGDRRAWAGLLAAWPTLPTAASVVLGALVMKRAVAAVVVLALLGLAAWFVATGPLSGPLSSSSAPLRSLEDGAEEAPRLAGRGEADTPETSVAPAPEPGPTCTHRLVVTLEPEGAWREGLAKVRAMPIRLMHPGDPSGAKDVPVEASTSGAPLEMDVSRLFGPHDLPMIEIEVTVDHPLYHLADTRLKVTEGRRESQDGPLVYRARVALVPTATLAGRVVLPDGTPAEGASVGVWFADATGQGYPTECVTTDQDGAYRLRVTRGGRHRVIALAHGWGPAVAEIEVRAEAANEAEDLVFTRGREVTGVVRINGRAVPGAALTYWPEGSRLGPDDVYTIHLSPLEVTYGDKTYPDHAYVQVARLDARWHVVRGRAVTDAKGRFRLPALARRAYRLTLDPRCAFGFIHRDLEDSSPLRIEADATEVGLDLEAHVLRVEVRAEGKPLARAYGRVKALGIYGAAAGPLPAGEEDGLTQPVLVAPGTRYRISGEAADHAGVEREITAGAARTESVERIDLPRSRTEDGAVTPPEGRVQVRIDASDGSVITRCGFELQRDGVWGARGRVRRDLVSEDGLFQLERIPPGLYTLQAHPGGTVWGGEGFWTLAECEIEVFDGRTSGMVLKTESGGRVRFKVLDRDRRPITARCTIRNAEGAEVPVLYVRRHSRAIGRGAGISAGSGPCGVDRALPPGRYVFLVRNWALKGRPYVEEAVEVEVEAGKVTDFEVVLPVE